MRVRTHLTGTTPLIIHNVQLADPDNQWTKEIAKITGKRNKTEEDRHEIQRLEWFGGLYVGTNGEGPVMPTSNIRRCFQEAAKVTKAGKDVVRSVIPLAFEVPILYDGPRDVTKLWERKEFVDIRMAGIQRGKIQRTRPIFPQWQIVAEFELVETTLDYDDFKAIVERSGIIEGLCDNRINGFGRFTTEVKKL